MATSPTTSLGKAREHLRDMLAASTALQAWVGVDEEDVPATAALSSIWYETLPLPAGGGQSYSATEISTYWPFAIIAVDGYRIRPLATETERDGGAFIVYFCGLADDSDNNPNETCVIWENVVAQILEDIADLREQAGYLDFNALEVVEGHVRSTPNDIAAGGRDELTMAFRVPWGV